MVRLIAGLIFLVSGIAAMLLWARPSGTILPWILSASFAFGGAFMLFEARAGWCVVRAMGFRTPW